jgi:hypothetical protein
MEFRKKAVAKTSTETFYYHPLGHGRILRFKTHVSRHQSCNNNFKICRPTPLLPPYLLSSCRRGSNNVDQSHCMWSGRRRKCSITSCGRTRRCEPEAHFELVRS